MKEALVMNIHRAEYRLSARRSALRAALGLVQGDEGRERLDRRGQQADA
jgi:hypothetical protein